MGRRARRSGLEELGWRLSIEPGPVKVTVKADYCQLISFRHRVMVGIVEIQTESFSIIGYTRDFSEWHRHYFDPCAVNHINYEFVEHSLLLGAK